MLKECWIVLWVFHQTLTIHNEDVVCVRNILTIMGYKYVGEYSSIKKLTALVDHKSESQTTLILNCIYLFYRWIGKVNIK